MPDSSADARDPVESFDPARDAIAAIGSNFRSNAGRSSETIFSKLSDRDFQKRFAANLQTSNVKRFKGHDRS
jgi:hypothetical protein